MPIRLLVSDIDGTLVTTEKVLTPGAIAAAKRLHEAGVMLAVVSSRPPRGMAMMVEPLGITAPIAGFNGGTIVAPDQSPIEARFVPEAAAHAAYRLFRERHVDIWVFADGEWLLTNPNAAYVPRELRTVQFKYNEVSDLTPYLARAGKIVGTSADFALLEACETELHGLLNGSANAHRSQKYYLDVTHPDANKGTALRALAAHLGVAVEDTAAIGDMTNDVPMLEIAGFSIAMGNAPDDVKSKAQAITASNEEDGWARAVDELVIPRSK